MSAPYPQFIPEAFAIIAAPADRNVIPPAPIGTQRASFDLGFPPLTMTPLIAGGKPMLGPDMNGVLYMMSTHTVYLQSGKLYLYSAAVAAAISGYAVGTLLGSTDGSTFWYNTVAANASDPDAGGAGWVAMYAYGITPITGLIGGVRTLTAAEASKGIITLTGALVANQQIELPAQIRRWLIVNATTGAFTTTVKTAGGSGVAVLQGGLNAPVEVWGDGTSIYNAVAPLSVSIDQAATALSIAQRTNAGYLFATYFNSSNPLENAAISGIYFDSGDGFHRKITPADFAAQITVSSFAGQVTNAQVPQSAVTQHSAAVLANAALTGTPTTPTAASGTSTTQVASTAFANPSGSLVQNGYQPLPGGLILQWGRTASLGAGGATAIAFPLVFPNAVFIVAATAQNTGGVAQATDSVTGKTVGGFNLNNAGSVSRIFDWFALGR